MPKKSTSTESEPAGKIVFVCGSKFSKQFALRAAEDFQAKRVDGAGQIVLPDGQIIQAGPTYETTTSPSLIQMVKDGILQASNFGKLKGGKLCQAQKAI
ncbi:MAG: hypothetical protein WC343_15255 [Bacilli bacterium]|jgi:hypothetical protein